MDEQRGWLRSVARETVWLTGWLVAGAVTALYLLDRWERTRARSAAERGETDSQVVRLEPRRTA